MIKLLHMTSNFVVKLIVMWSNFDPHDKQNFAPQTMSAASGTIMMYGNNKPYAKYNIQGVFFNWYPPKKLKYRKPRLGESTLT